MQDKKRSCFVIMPIQVPDAMTDSYSKFGGTDHFRDILERLFMPAIRKIGYSPIPPLATGADIIHAEIIRNLVTADLVLCDISTLNPNVFFELGIRTAVNKPVSLVKDHLTSIVPIDTGLINHHSYDASLYGGKLNNEVQQLSKHLQTTINRSHGGNTLWRYFGQTTRAESPTPYSADEKLNIILKLLERMADRNNMLPPEQIAQGEPLATEKEVVNRAQLIAAKIEAELIITNIAQGRIELDLGGYVMDDSYRQQIIRLGSARGVEVMIHGGLSPV
jgi:hypothetical protein